MWVQIPRLPLFGSMVKRKSCCGSNAEFRVQILVGLLVRGSIAHNISERKGRTMATDIPEAFEAIGADVHVEVSGDVFEIDVRQNGDRELYQLTYPRRDEIQAEVLDVKPTLRHLVLDVTGWRLPVSGRYLCGHDERHWFVASLPFGRRTMTVRGAMEAIKPAVVLREQERKGVRHRRYRRKTAAYVRQGEWFFLPRPMMHVGERAIRNSQLVRGAGKPHRVQWLFRAGDKTFVRGAVSHPDHETIYLQEWHRVVQNNEAKPAPQAEPFTRMAYLD